MDNGTTPPSDHSLFYRSCAVEGRQFDLYVEFGTSSPSSDQLGRVNNVLATLQIAPPESPAPTESPGVLTVVPVSVDLPPGWIENDDPVPGTSASRVVAAYGTWDLPTGGGCGSEAALQDLKKTKKGRKIEGSWKASPRRIGPKMNDHAEYKALLEGLRTVIKHEATHVRAFMDSEFIVEQINNGVTRKRRICCPSTEKLAN